MGKAKSVFRDHEYLAKLQVRRTKEIFLYSTFHHKNEISKDGKPAIVHDYNKSKFGIDQFDEMCKRHAYAPKVNRWPLRLFMHLCDAAAVNARILYSVPCERYSFLMSLSKKLMNPLIERHAKNHDYITQAFTNIAKEIER